MNCSSERTFEGIVTEVTPVGRIDRRGKEVRLVACLPPRASHIELARYAALQDAHKGSLEIVRRRGRIMIEQTAVVCSLSGLRRLKGSLARDVKTHLDVITTIQ